MPSTILVVIIVVLAVALCAAVAVGYMKTNSAMTKGCGARGSTSERENGKSHPRDRTTCKV